MTVTPLRAREAFYTDSDLSAARERLGPALPRQGWIARYLEAATPLTDAPVEFSLISGMCALAASLGNSVWIESWGQRVYPHLWAVVVAPSSFWRKSTSISIAERLLREANDTRALPSDFSREKLLAILSKQPVGMLTLKEFGGFLASMGREYMGGLKETLTELYDGPDEYVRSLQSGEITIERPAVTLLAATTLDWLESRITEGDLRGGFLGRFLFVTATDKASPKGLTRGMDGLDRMHLRDHLKSLAMRPEKAARLDPHALDLLNAWMASWEEEVTSQNHRSDLTGFAVRLQTYAIKFAMLYRASAVMGDESQDDTQIDADAMSSAIAYCRVLWNNVASLVDDQIAISREAKELRRLKGIIGRGITRSDALRLSKLKARDFDAYVDTLVQSGEVMRARKKASELGLERQRDKAIEWLWERGSVPLEFPTGPTVPDAYGSELTESELNGSVETEKPSNSNTPLSLSTSSYTSLHTDTSPPEIHVYREGENARTPARAHARDDAPAVEDDQSSRRFEDRPSDGPELVW